MYGLPSRAATTPLTQNFGILAPFRYRNTRAIELQVLDNCKREIFVFKLERCKTYSEPKEGSPDEILPTRRGPTALHVRTWTADHDPDDYTKAGHSGFIHCHQDRPCQDS